MVIRNVAVRAFDTALSHQWAMQEEHLRALFEIAARDPGPALEALAVKNDRALDNTRRATVRDGVAIVPVMGPLFRYANLFTELSGATSMEVLATDFQMALDDPKVRAIVLNHDTPGGDVNGIAEMASTVMTARGRKPVVSYVGHLCCSGGYWIASAADQVLIAPTALVGSVGAVLTVRDTRAADEKRGIRTLEFVSAVSPDKRRDPTSDEGRAKLQAIADRLGEEFVAAVARQRGVSAQKVLADFGKGGVFVGADAVTAGMVDGVSTLEQVIASLSSAASPAGGSVRSFIPRAAAAAQSEKKPMDINTVADLTAAYPELVAQIRKDGATAERTRILGIQAHARAGAEKLVADAIADGKTTPYEASARIASHLDDIGSSAPTVLTADEASKAIRAEMDAAEKAGLTISLAEAGSRVRARMAKAA